MANKSFRSTAERPDSLLLLFNYVTGHGAKTELVVSLHRRDSTVIDKMESHCCCCEKQSSRTEILSRAIVHNTFGLFQWLLEFRFDIRLMIVIIAQAWEKGM